jgi:hypothetical protein
MNSNHPQWIDRKPHHKKSVGAVSLVGVCALGLLGWLLIQQPPDGGQTNQPVLQPNSDGSSTFTPFDASAPTSASRQEPPLDAKSDPLFQEIQRLILEKQAMAHLTLGPTANSPSGPAPQGSQLSSGTNSADAFPTISNSTWHAAESILAAARMLEQDVENFVKQKKFDEAARIHAIINHLRTQARQLLVP